MHHDENDTASPGLCGFYAESRWLCFAQQKMLTGRQKDHLPKGMKKSPQLIESSFNIKKEGDQVTAGRERKKEKKSSFETQIRSTEHLGVGAPTS